MAENEILNKLYSLHRFGIKPGLERTLNLLAEFGEPHKKFPSVHVAGTNGKGSVCSRIASILMEAGLRTGLYTSPHILRFNERIRINGEMIPDAELYRLAKDMLPFSDKYGCTFFEITTAIAFKYFEDHKVDVAIIETGMGGRFDSTNVIEPLLSIITKIDYDHQEYLGNSITDIAFEKSGIIKPDVKAIIAYNDKQVNEIFTSRAKETGSELLFVPEQYKGSIKCYKPDISMLIDVETPFGTIYNIVDPLAGEHQLNNLLTSIAAIDNLKDHYVIPDDAIIKGLANVKTNTGLNARISLLREEPPIVIDVAHNPGGIKILFDTLEKCGYKDTQWNIVFGVMSDKDAELMLSYMCNNCNTLYAVVPEIERAMDIYTLSGKAKKAGIKEVIPAGKVADGVASALKKPEPIIICGSFYLVEEAYIAFNMEF